MERKIGEIFEFNGEWYQCVESQDGSCKHCDMNFEGKCPIPIKECTESGRSDKSYVIFKKLEKVGEPYEHYEKLYQCYKLPMETEIRIVPDNCYPIGKDNLVEIEIKQTKEDMEEKKLNLKPFDIQKARAGKPVCTRDGRKARIICFDRNDLYPIVALIECEEGKEIIGAYSKEGQTDIYEIKGTDLMMIPEKGEGWVNIYKGIGGITFSKHPYPSKEEAIKNAGIMSNRIDTVKICWEE